MLSPRLPPGPGQRSVWDFPRPPALEREPRRLRVVFAGVTVADTTAGYRVLETSHPPVYYFPTADVRMNLLTRAGGASVCEWKGHAVYYDLHADGRRVNRVAWSYPKPTPRFAAIADYLAFYAGPMDAVFVGDERATPQPGGFYGGWVTADLSGPFKGAPGTMGW